jgi:hypothetical protein
MTAEANYRLLLEIDANRRFMLLAYRSNPRLLARAEPELRALLEEVPAAASAVSQRLTFAAVKGVRSEDAP